MIFSSFKNAVRIGLRNLLNELLTMKSVEFQVVQVKDVRDSVAEETGVVRNDDWNN